MQSFDVQMRIQAATGNIKPIVSQIKQQLNSAGANSLAGSARNVDALNRNVATLLKNMNLIDNKTIAVSRALNELGRIGSKGGMANLNRDVQLAARNLVGLHGRISDSRSELRKFGEQAALSFRRFSAYTVGALGVYKLVGAMREGVSEALKFQKAMIQLEQLGVQSSNAIKSISDNITKLSTSLGTSSAELAETTKYLKGAGLSIDEVNSALTVLAKTAQSPTFKSIRDSTEGLLASIAQFKLGAKDYERAFDTINAVAQRFAAESEDLVEAIRRSGSAFAAASSQFTAPKEQLNQLIALFTAVRSTTRESAETIGTSFRTIFSRLQSNSVAKDLKNIGVNIHYTRDEAVAMGKDVEGQFVGAYEAIGRLSKALKNVPTTDPLYSAIVERIGGQRQVSKVIPLLQQYEKAQQALTVAQTSNNSVNRDAAKAQEALLNKLQRVQESFVSLFRTMTESRTFGLMVDGFTQAATAATQLVKALDPLLPLIAAVGTIKFGLGFREAAIGFAGTVGHARPRIGFASGGKVSGPGTGTSDSVPAMVSKDEYILPANVAKSVGYGKLDALRSGNASVNVGMLSGRDAAMFKAQLPLIEGMKKMSSDELMKIFTRKYAKGGRVTGNSKDTKRVEDILRGILGFDVDLKSIVKGGASFGPVDYKGQDVASIRGKYDPDAQALIVREIEDKARMAQTIAHEFAHGLSHKLAMGATGPNRKNVRFVGQRKSIGKPFRDIGDVGFAHLISAEKMKAYEQVDPGYFNRPGMKQEEGFTHAFAAYIRNKQGISSPEFQHPEVQKAFGLIEQHVIPHIKKLSGIEDKEAEVRKIEKQQAAELRGIGGKNEEGGYVVGEKVRVGGNRQSIGRDQLVTGAAILNGGGIANIGHGAHFSDDSNSSGSRGKSGSKISSDLGDSLVATEEFRKELGITDDDLKERRAVGNENFGRGLAAGAGGGASGATPRRRLQIGTRLPITKPAASDVATTEGMTASPRPLAVPVAPLPIDDKFEHPNARVMAGLRAYQHHYGLSDLKSGYDEIVSAVKSGKIDLPSIGRGGSATPHVVGAIKRLLPELGYEGSFSKTDSGGYTGSFYTAGNMPKVSRVKKVAAPVSVPTTGSANLPAVRGDNGRHAFIRDFVNASGATTDAERKAAAIKARQFYDSSTLGGSNGVISMGGGGMPPGGDGSPPPVPPNKGGRPRGSGGSPPHDNNLLKQILAELKTHTGLLRGVGGGGGVASSSGGGTTTRRRGVRRRGTGAGTVGGLPTQPALGSSVHTLLGLPKPTRSFRTQSPLDSLGVIAAGGPTAIPLEGGSPSIPPEHLQAGFDEIAMADRGYTPYDFADIKPGASPGYGRPIQPDYTYAFADDYLHNDINRGGHKLTGSRAVTDRARKKRGERIINELVTSSGFSTLPFAHKPEDYIHLAGEEPDERIGFPNFEHELMAKQLNKRFYARNGLAIHTGFRGLLQKGGMKLRTMFGHGGSKAEISDATQEAIQAIAPEVDVESLASAAHGLSDTKLGGKLFGGKHAGLKLGALAVGASYAPRIAEGLFGTVASPTSKYGVAGAKYAAGAGGLLQGAGAGAAIGSLVGPWGTAIGAAVGAVHGFVSALNDADKEIKNVEFEKSFTKFTSSLEDVISGKSVPSGSKVGAVKSGLSAINKKISDSEDSGFFGNIGYGLTVAAHGLVGNGGNYINQEREDRRKQIVQEHLVPQAPALKEFGNKIAEGLTFTPGEGVSKSQRVAKFEAAGGREIVQHLSEATGISVKQLQDEFDKVAVEANKERVAREANVKVIAAQTRQAQQFNRISQAIDAATNSIGHLQNSADALQAAFHGNLQSINVRGRANDANIGNLDTAAFNAAVGHVTSSLGGEGNPLIGDFGTTARGLNSASLSLPSLINQARQGTSLTDEGEGFADKLKSSIQDSTDIPNVIKEGLSRVLDSIKPEDLAEKAGENVQKLSEELLQKGFAEVGTVLQNAAKQLEERANAFSQGVVANQELIARVGESRDKGAGLRLQAFRSRVRYTAEKAGRPSDANNIGLSALEVDRVRQERLAGGNAFNPAAIGAQLQATQTQISATKAARDNSSGDAQTALSERLAELQGNAQRLNQALEHLADSSERNAAIQERLNKLEEDRQGRLGFTEKFLTADAHGQREIARNAFATDVAVSQGNFRGFSAQNVQRVLEHLSSLGNATLKGPGYNGATAADVRQKLLLNSGLANGFISAKGEKERQNLIGQQAKNDETAVKAQEQLIQHQQGLQQEFYTELKNIEQQFLDKLRQTLLEGEKRHREVAFGSAVDEQRKAGAAANALVNLKGSGLNLDTARKLSQSQHLAELESGLRQENNLGVITHNLGKELGAQQFHGLSRGQTFNKEDEDNITFAAAKHLGVSQTDARKTFTTPFIKKLYENGNDISSEGVQQQLQAHVGAFKTERATQLRTDNAGLVTKISEELTGKLGAPIKEFADAIKQFAGDREKFSKDIEALKNVGGETDVHRNLNIANQKVAIAQHQLNAVTSQTSRPNVTTTIVNTPPLPKPQEEKKEAVKVPGANPRDAVRKVPEAGVPADGVAARHDRPAGAPAPVQVPNAGAAPEVNPDMKGEMPAGLVPPNRGRKLTKRQQLILGNRRKAPLGQQHPNKDVQAMIDAQQGHAFTGVGPDGKRRVPANQIRQTPRRNRPGTRDAIIKKNTRQANGVINPNPDVQAKIDAQKNHNFTGVAPPPKKPKPPVQQPQDLQKVPMQDAAGKTSGINGVGELGKTVADFNSAIGTLNGTLTAFTKSMGELNGMKMSLEKNGRIEVVLNGAEVMKSIQGDLAQTVTRDVMAAIQSQLPKILGDMPARA